MKLNFRVKGYVSRQYLWTFRRRNGYTTTLPLEVFVQRNLVADFIRLLLSISAVVLSLSGNTSQYLPHFLVYFLSFFSFPQLISELAERNSTMPDGRK